MRFPFPIPPAPFAYGSIEIIEDSALVVWKDKVVKRSWRERLFSLPWRPLVKEKAVTEAEPDPNIYYVSGTAFCHPAVAAQLREHIANEQEAVQP